MLVALNALFTIVTMFGAEDIKWNGVVPSVATVAMVDPNGLVGAISETHIRFGSSTAHRKRAETR